MGRHEPPCSLIRPQQTAPLTAFAPPFEVDECRIVFFTRGSSDGCFSSHLLADLSGATSSDNVDQTVRRWGPEYVIAEPFQVLANYSLADLRVLLRRDR